MIPSTSEIREMCARAFKEGATPLLEQLNQKLQLELERKIRELTQPQVVTTTFRVM